MLNRCNLFSFALLLLGCSDGTSETSTPREEIRSVLSDAGGAPSQADPLQQEATPGDASGPGDPLAATPEVQALMDAYAEYATWQTFSENSARMESSGHAPGGNAMWVISYKNGIVDEAEAWGILPLPDGSIIVKENYGSEDAPEPMALTVMSKQKGKWFWLQATPSGRVLTDPEGKAMAGTDVPMCLSCHAQAEANDYLFFHPFVTPSSVGADGSVEDAP